MKDIADRAGVSLTTVSRALQNKPEISLATTRRIHEIAAEIGYVQNTLARSLRSQRTNIVGLVITDSSNPYFGQVLKGVEQTLNTGGYGLILSHSDELYRNEIDALNVLIGRRVDGILITPAQASGDDIVGLMQAHLPFVLLGRRFAGLETDYVVADDIAGAHSATEHLIRLGHSRILLLNGSSHISSAVERQKGYEQALEDFGIQRDPDLVRHCAPTMESAYNSMKTVLIERIPFSAVFSFSDLMAMGVVRALRETGKRIPDDISVVGFDDIEVSELLEPSLTTVRVPRFRLGVEAARALLSRIGGTPTLIQTVLPTELVVRKSTSRV